MNDLVERADKTQETLDIFAWKPMDYPAGRHCAGMIAASIKVFTGEDLIPGWAKSAKSEKAALRAWVKANKDDGVRKALDERFVKIHPLEALAGDVVEFPADEESPGTPALGLAAGAGMVAAYIKIEGVSVCAVDRALVAGVQAWRIPLKGKLPCLTSL